MTENVSSIRS